MIVFACVGHSVDAFEYAGDPLGVDVMKREFIDFEVKINFDRRHRCSYCNEYAALAIRLRGESTPRTLDSVHLYRSGIK